MSLNKEEVMKIFKEPCYCCDFGYEDEDCTCLDKMYFMKEYPEYYKEYLEKLNDPNLR